MLYLSVLAFGHIIFNLLINLPVCMADNNIDSKHSYKYPDVCKQMKIRHDIIQKVANTCNDVEIGHYLTWESFGTLEIPKKSRTENCRFFCFDELIETVWH